MSRASSKFWIQDRVASTTDVKEVPWGDLNRFTGGLSTFFFFQTNILWSVKYKK